MQKLLWAFFVAVAALASAAGRSSDAQTRTADNAVVRIFRDRILPIVRSDRPSSCTECHLAGVDLRQFVSDDPYATLAALVAQGWVDPDRPRKSRLLQLITRRPDKEDPMMARVRKAEYEAFLAWIEAAARDPLARRVRPETVRIGIELPPEVIRHARKDRVLQAFVDTIWPEVGRCISCHAADRNQRLVAKWGDHISWVQPHDPEETLRRCVANGLIDTEQPEKSLLLLKPLGEVEHGGGPKFVRGSRADKAFRRFLSDYAATVTGRYRSAHDLPPIPGEVLRPTHQHLRIRGIPRRWAGRLMRVDLYRWQGDGWSRWRWATADNPVTRRGVWQSLVMATAPRGSKRAAELGSHPDLPAGRYLVRIFIDRSGRLEKDRDAELGPEDLVAEVELRGPWPPGYWPPKILRFPVRHPGGQVRP